MGNEASWADDIPLPSRDTVRPVQQSAEPPFRDRERNVLFNYRRG